MFPGEFVRKIMLIFVRGVQNVANPVVLVFFLCGKKSWVVKTVWKFLDGISQNDLPGFSNHGWKMSPCFADDFPIICDAHVVKGFLRHVR